jgi:uncharacterized integral membrane protein
MPDSQIDLPNTPLEPSSLSAIRAGIQLLNWGLLAKFALYCGLFAWFVHQISGILPLQENADEKPSPEVIAKLEALQLPALKMSLAITLVGGLFFLAAFRKFRSATDGDLIGTTAANLWYCAWFGLALLCVLLVLLLRNQDSDSVIFRALTLVYQIFGCGVLMFLASYFQQVSQRLADESLLELANRLRQLALLFSIFSTYVSLVSSTLPFKHEVQLQGQEPNAFVSLASPMLLASLFAGAWGLYIYYRWQRLAYQLLNPATQNRSGSM